ncbi:MAG: T9SS type A sorting domain-containing protein [Crocinitomicaceae bacterium]|nr:MAG: T9SS type A sorting domain-containing protein [Crocinitomicaceae bacterium]
MKKQIILLLLFFFQVTSFKSQVNCIDYSWLNNRGSDYQFGSSKKNGIATSSNGTSYIIGDFENYIDLGVEILFSSGHSSFIAKLNSDGYYVWAKQIVSPNYCHVESISINSTSEIYITGSYSGVASFDNITLSSSQNITNSFIAKLDSSGNFIWASSIVSNNSSSISICSDISIDANGNSYIAGSFTGSVNFGSTPNVTSTQGGYSLFLAKIDNLGNFTWRKNLGGTGNEFETVVNGIAVDQNGNSYITGGYKGTLSLGANTISSNTLQNLYIIKHNSQGDYVWHKTLTSSSPNTHTGIGIGLDGEGNCYFSGRSSSDFITIDNTTIQKSNSSFYSFIGKTNTNGNLIWLKKASNCYVENIVVDSDNNCSVIGRHASYVQVSFDAIMYYSNGGRSMAKIDGSGNFVWASEISSSLNSAYKVGLSCDNYGNLFFIMDFNGFQSFGSQSLSGDFNSNFVVAKLSEAELMLSPMSEITLNCGQATTLQGISSGYTSLTWSPSTGLNNTSILTPTANPLSTTTYSLTATDVCGNSLTESIKVNVVAPFSVEASTSQNQINCGSTTQLVASLNDNTLVTYNWYPTSNLNNSTLANPIASPGLSTMYYVVATSTNGCSTSDSVFIQVNNPNPPIVDITSNTGMFKLCDNGLTLSANGFESYEWSNGSTQPSIQITEEGTYTLTAYDQSGCAGISTVTITPLAEISTPQGTVLCPDQTNQSLQLIASGGMDSYSWNTGNQTQSIQVSNAGNYSCIVTKGNCSFTTNKQITINNGSASADFSYTSNGNTISFYAISPSINFLSWDFGDGEISFEENPIHTYSSEGSYEVVLTVTDVCGNTAETTKTVEVGALGNIELSPIALIIFPNPTENKLSVSSNEIIDVIQIKDLSGKRIHQIAVGQTETKLNLENLSQGVYLIEVGTKRGVRTERIIKN